MNCGICRERRVAWSASQWATDLKHVVAFNWNRLLVRGRTIRWAITIFADSLLMNDNWTNSVSVDDDDAANKSHDETNLLTLLFFPPSDWHRGDDMGHIRLRRRARQRWTERPERPASGSDWYKLPRRARGENLVRFSLSYQLITSCNFQSSTVWCVWLMAQPPTTFLPHRSAHPRRRSKSYRKA